ncbi:hypothetical protein [Rhizobium leguminosarum]|uniref:hypothetical protein n=1 Tax=Rhizobium leguminosarum TaxID=384 RepID=UPI00036F275C|nr:hypothetical protein [Rhizobium leguminosarum]
MNSYTDESGFDGVVPAHPIECENPSRVRTMTLGEVAQMALETNNMRSTREKPNPFVSPLDKGSQTTGIKSIFDDLPGGKENSHYKAELAELEACVGPNPADEEIAANLISEVDSSSSPNNLEWVATRLCQHRQQAVAEATAGLVEALQLAVKTFPLTSDDPRKTKRYVHAHNVMQQALSGLSAAQRGEGR